MKALIIAPATAILAAIIPGPALAGCANYTDGSLDTSPPEATICFRRVCEKTTVEFDCANIHGSQKGYANGWRVYVDADRKPAVVHVFRPVLVPKPDLGKITCQGDCFTLPQ
ncbi:MULTISPECIES: hypothetical protein [unclassified Mesorhizobium]|uniref:hypothetical protein n=1 Tax=unclassified Mesorhizobium TaxID=325217 RepID=UPI0033356EAA